MKFNTDYKINIIPDNFYLPINNQYFCGDPNYKFSPVNTMTELSTNTFTSSSWKIQIISCKLCGKEFKPNTINTSFFNYGLKFCKDCEKLLVEKIASLLIPKDSKVHCFKCMSHINACECNTKKAMDNLKK